MKTENIILTVVIVIFALVVALVAIYFLGFGAFVQEPTSVEVGPATPVSAP